MTKEEKLYTDRDNANYWWDWLYEAEREELLQKWILKEFKRRNK